VKYSHYYMAVEVQWMTAAPNGVCSTWRALFWVLFPGTVQGCGTLQLRGACFNSAILK